MLKKYRPPQYQISRMVREHRESVKFDQNWLEDLHEKLVVEMPGVRVRGRCVGGEGKEVGVQILCSLGAVGNVVICVMLLV